MASPFVAPPVPVCVIVAAVADKDTAPVTVAWPFRVDAALTVNAPDNVADVAVVWPVTPSVPDIVAAASVEVPDTPRVLDSDALVAVSSS
jgi:hypothetical protein